ncbi:MAG: GTPase HflX, partial [Halioglobus sp.]|nr:GTPase HflX [Halioglobus sp.]
HVVDAADTERERNMYEVQEVLSEIGADRIPCLQVFNKLDLLQQPARIERDADGKPVRVWVSAATGEGSELLREAIAELLAQDMVAEQVRIEPSQGSLRAALYQMGAVEAEEYCDDGAACLSVRLPRADWNRLMKQGAEAPW